MTYLVDTDWLASYLNGHQRAVALLRELAPLGLAQSLVTYGEIYEGIYSGPDPSVDERAFLNLLRVIPVLPLTKLIMRRFARIRGQLRQQGLLLGDADLLIAATAIQHDLELVTRNVRHFHRIAGLKLYQPPQP
jgi:tRNA(fMet)-specific endonuclease VapC